MRTILTESNHFARLKPVMQPSFWIIELITPEANIQAKVHRAGLFSFGAHLCVRVAWGQQWPKELLRRSLRIYLLPLASRNIKLHPTKKRSRLD
jgi:hypothetical protein